MHILLIPSFYPSRVRPVVGVFFQDQALALQRSGHRVDVLVAPRIRETIDYLWQNRQIVPPLMQQEKQGEAGHVYRIHRGWFIRFFPKITAFLHRRVASKAFELYLKQHGKPDVLHAHNIFYSGYMATQLGRTHNIPVIITEHSSNFLLGRIFLPAQHTVIRKTLQNTHYVAAVGKTLATRLNGYDEINVHVLGNLVDTGFFVPYTPPKPQPFIFGVVAHLRAIKNIPLLLRAFAKAFKGQDVQLIIGGDGPERSKLERLAKKLGIQAQVQFLGWLSRPAVRDLYHGSHCVVSSSNIETFGLTLLEAMACGKPVITTQSGGPSDFVTPTTGLVIPRKNESALIEAMRSLRQHYDGYDATHIRGYVVNHFSEKAIVSQLEAIYGQMIEQI